MSKIYLRDEKSIEAFRSVCLHYRLFLEDQLEQIVDHMKDSSRNWKMVINIPDTVYDSSVDCERCLIKGRKFRYQLPTGNMVDLTDYQSIFKGAKHSFTWHTIQYGFKKGTHYKERDEVYWSVLDMVPPFRQVQISFLKRYGLYVTDETRSQMHPKIGISTSAPSGKIAKMWHGYNKPEVQKVATKSSQTKKYVDPLENLYYTREINSRPANPLPLREQLRDRDEFCTKTMVVFTWIVLFLWIGHSLIESNRIMSLRGDYDRDL